jgi:DNA (cytosine-5)-methyltransferase 1
MHLRTIDLFSGIGGIRLGVEQACKEHGVSHECVFSSEIKSDPIKVYREHFGNNPDPLYDITKAEGHEAEVIPDFDMMLFGFPCQSFSQAGQGLGFKDETRGTLFFNVASILEAKKPAAFLLENVKGLVTHDNGRTFNIIKKTLISLGYHITYKVLNSRDFGVPHNRPRIYMVGFLDQRIGRGFRMPSITNSNSKLEDILEIGPVDPRFFISQQYLDSLKAHRARHMNKGSGFGYEVKSRKGVASCLVLGGMGLERNLIHDITSLPEPVVIKGRRTMTNSDNLRKLTPVECERLQGLPDQWTACISDTARYDALANSVTVPVIKAIAASMLEEMLHPSGRDDENNCLVDEFMDDESGSREEDREKEKQEGVEGSQQVWSGTVQHLQDSTPSC